jgi:hypothetical protein
MFVEHSVTDRNAHAYSRICADDSHRGGMQICRSHYDHTSVTRSWSGRQNSVRKGGSARSRASGTLFRWKRAGYGGAGEEQDRCIVCGSTAVSEGSVSDRAICIGWRDATLPAVKPLPECGAQ